MINNEYTNTLHELLKCWHDVYGATEVYYDGIAMSAEMALNKPVPVQHYRNGFLDLVYCGGCSSIVSRGDKYCHDCGRRLLYND